MDATQVGFDDPRATITGETQGTTAVSDLNAAQGTASIIDSPVQRDIQAGEIVTGSAVDVEKAAQFTEQIQAAQASPWSWCFKYGRAGYHSSYYGISLTYRNGRCPNPITV